MILLSSFVFGLIFGSFLNVVIYRLKTPPRRGGTTKDIIFGRSFCPECKTKLNWRDLIPIFSFIWLYGKCRYCQRKISWQYPFIEILSGLIWVLVFYKIYGLNSLNSLNFLNLLNFFYYIFIFSALLILAVYDFKWRIIPDKIVYLAIIAVFIYNFLNSNFMAPLIIAAIAFLFFFLIYFLSKGRAMGLGDAKLGFLIGLFLGPLYSFISFTASFIIGAVFGILLIASKKKSWKSQIAFGPFLVLGAFIAFFFYDLIIKFINSTTYY